MIRPARQGDIPALVALENRCFSTDRLSRRSFLHLLKRGHAETLVDDSGEQLRGYVMVLFHRGTSLARIYSIAVEPQFAGRGIGGELVQAAETAAVEEGAVSVRLEVRVDNPASLALFRRAGYREFGRYADYYEDHADALRFEKRLVSGLRADMARVPYYSQTLDFTCGPASLMMAMKSLEPTLELNRHLELSLWRESTSIFMTAGHGGCGPYGLALAAHRRGFAVEVWVSDEEEHFVDSVRSEEKKEVIRLVNEEFRAEVAEAGIPVHVDRITVDGLQERFDAGGIPLVLISSYRLYKEKFPHWVVLTGFDNRFVYLHDPFVDVEAGRSETDTVNLPVRRDEFERMARYGKRGLQAVVVIYKGK